MKYFIIILLTTFILSCSKKIEQVEIGCQCNDNTTILIGELPDLNIICQDSCSSKGGFRNFIYSNK